MWSLVEIKIKLQNNGSQLLFIRFMILYNVVV